VILDNATFHHGGRIAELIEAVGCRLYLPAYSPDLNRIVLGLAQKSDSQGLIYL